jgi:hypothetical protein
MGKYFEADNSVQLPKNLTEVFAGIQLAVPNGKDSAPVRAGQPLVFSDRAGKKLFVVVLGTHYTAKTGEMRVALVVKNLAIPNAQAKRTKAVVDVTVGYRR